MNINIVKTELKLGATAPFKLLHVTDSHIALDDPDETTLLPNGIPQITTAGGFKGYAREITVI